MNTGLIAARYASALIMYASDHRAGHDLYLMMKRISGFFTLEAELEKTFCNRMISREKRKELFLDMFPNYPRESLQVLSGFLDLLIQQRREHIIRYACLQYIHLYRKKHGITYGVLTTVVPVDEGTADRIKKLLEPVHPENVELEMKQDARLLGGFSLRVGMDVWDASLAARMRKVRKAYGLTDNNQT